MGVFNTREPFGQSVILKEGTVEYHIYYDVYDNYSFTYDYRSATSRDFMDDVYKYMLNNCGGKLLNHGSDRNYSDDGVEDYIWVHIQKKSAEQDITSILECLEAQYLSVWRFQRIPTLLTLVRRQLKKPKVLAYAVSDFQRRCGVVKTQNVLHVFFNDINSIISTQTYI